MEIKNTTPYSYETLMEFNRQHKRKLITTMTVIICICAGIMLLAVIASAILSALEIEPFNTQIAVAATVYILIAVFLLLWPSLHRKKTCTKQAAVHTVASYTFNNEGFTVASTSDTERGERVCQYTVIAKVTESESAYYLYVNHLAAHIVSKTGFTEGTEQEFRTLLRTVIEPKKLSIR